MNAKIRYGLSAAVLALIAAGAPAPDILDQFLDEKEGNHTTAYRDGAGIWTICRGAILVDGKPVVPGMKLSKEKCDRVTDMQMRQRDVAALDAKYTKELADAKAENETLRADVAAGRKRLRINATCPGPVREATGTARVDNATGPQLADTVTRDYFTLRERLMTMQKQLEGAQEYIRTQCLK
ncbi:lysis system i-spanin subunit Rz [Escherichia coli]|nr:lysis system i-spanin subunit Rz [Escherichia coli]KDY11485.1 bacteriophage lysis family protein [Escherichia coli 2-316-03_S4_C2]